MTWFFVVIENTGDSKYRVDEGATQDLWMSPCWADWRRCSIRKSRMLSVCRGLRREVEVVDVARQRFRSGTWQMYDNLSSICGNSPCWSYKCCSNL